jgi:hypothetical protein
MLTGRFSTSSRSSANRTFLTFESSTREICKVTRRSSPLCCRASKPLVGRFTYTRTTFEAHHAGKRAGTVKADHLKLMSTVVQQVAKGSCYSHPCSHLQSAHLSRIRCNCHVRGANATLEPDHGIVEPRNEQAEDEPDHRRPENT